MTTVQQFSDVPDILNSFDAIHSLRKGGFVVGVGNNEYKPFDTVTRAQKAVFITRAKYGAHYKPPTPNNLPPDVTVDYWGASWIGAALDAKLMDLYQDGNFYPRNPASRADVAILFNALR